MTGDERSGRIRQIRAHVHPVIRALEKRRRELRITQRVLAARLGYNLSSVSNWERGRNQPSLRHVSDLAEALGLELTVAAKVAPRPWPEGVMVPGRLGY